MHDFPCWRWQPFSPFQAAQLLKAPRQRKANTAWRSAYVLGTRFRSQALTRIPSFRTTSKESFRSGSTADSDSARTFTWELSFNTGLESYQATRTAAAG